jgi:hypothetical protein
VAEEEQARLQEEQRLEMEELQRQIEEERKAREEAERDLGLREEGMALEDEAARVAEEAAEAKKELAIIYAVKEKDVMAVRGLCRHHPDAVFVKDKNQRTALHFVEDEDCTTALLKAKADPNAADMGLWTPLHNATSKRHLEVARSIMGAGGNVLMTTRHGNSPLDLAYDQPEMTKMLLSAIPELLSTLEPEDQAAALGQKALAAGDEQQAAEAAGVDIAAAAGDAAPPADIPPSAPSGGDMQEASNASADEEDAEYVDDEPSEEEVEIEEEPVEAPEPESAPE